MLDTIKTTARQTNRALEADTDRTDAATMVFLLETEGTADDGHGGTVSKPAAWDNWEPARRQRWAGAVMRRIRAQGSRMGRQRRDDGTLRAGTDHADLSAALSIADPRADHVARLEARETLRATAVLSDPKDRETLLAIADAMGAEVVGHRRNDSARTVRQSTAWDPRNGLPKGTAARVRAALGWSAVTFSRRLARLRGNVAPMAEGLRTAGKVRADAVQASAVVAALDAAMLA